jgi:acyl-CoA thioesterase-1
VYCVQASARDARIVVLGDSLSAGYGLALDEGWVHLLKQRLAGREPAYSVINASVSGDTTEGGRARIAALLQQHQPAVVLVELGGNDGLRGLALTRTRDNLRAIVSACQEAGAKVLLVGVRLPPNYGPAFLAGFARIFQDISAQHEVALVPRILADIAEHAELMQGDGIHPTAEAQAQVLANIWPTLRQVLAQP